MVNKDDKLIELARLAMAGDKRALEDLCSISTRGIIYNAMNILDNAADAQDVCSEVHIAIWKGIKNLKSPEAVNVWILRIVQNISRKFLAKRKVHISIDEVVEKGNEPLDEDTDFIPEKRLLKDEMANTLYNIVQSLPPARREAIILYYYDNLSYKEIAQVTEKTTKTVSTNLIRARKMIKERIQKLYPDIDDVAFVSDEALTQVLDQKSLEVVPDAIVKSVKRRLPYDEE
jgi:RNA polymerase sigma-70 factor (ECF subfamily)